MKERLRDHLSEGGESFDCLRSDVKNLSRYMVTLTPSTPGERATLRKLLKRTLKIVGPPPGALDQGEVYDSGKIEGHGSNVQAQERQEGDDLTSMLYYEKI